MKCSADETLIARPFLEVTLDFIENLFKQNMSNRNKTRNFKFFLSHASRSIQKFSIYIRFTENKKADEKPYAYMSLFQIDVYKDSK